MEMHEVMAKRRTIRIFKKKASEEQLKKIILAGTQAPSAGNSQPWEFIIIDDQKTIDQIAEQKYQLSLTMPPRAGEGQDKVQGEGGRSEEIIRECECCCSLPSERGSGKCLALHRKYVFGCGCRWFGKWDRGLLGGAGKGGQKNPWYSGRL